MGGKYDFECEKDFGCKSPERNEEEEAYIPSPKKYSKKRGQKKVVTVPIGGRSRGEAYPPPDSWSWRKYGQKPIKGSPYPRGYYKCSSSKDCPARKQVERSRHDPTTMLITYSFDHNHSTTKNHRPNIPQVKAAESSEPSTCIASGTPPAACGVVDQYSTDIATHGPPESGDVYAEFAGELGWICEVGSTIMDVGPVSDHGNSEMEMFMSIVSEEDELLFGDLGDLPETSLVFRHVQTPCCGGIA